MSDSYRLTERTLLDATGKAVPSGHPDGIRVLGNVGKEIPLEVAVEVGLVSKREASAAAAEESPSFWKRLFGSAPADKAVRLETDGKETK